MPLIVSDSLHDLQSHAADNVCVIKGVLESALCDDLVREIEIWGRHRAPNEARGENWWYRVQKSDSEFDSFLFWQLHRLEPVSLREKLLAAYAALFQAHQLCGTIEPERSFDDMLVSDGEQLSLEPLVFFYKPGSGRFQRHAHESGEQQTQVLINLTKRNRDYAGGETVVEEPDGNLIELGEVFDQGDLFSFPYTLYHSVRPVTSPNSRPGFGRMSILLPYHRPRASNRTRYD